MVPHTDVARVFFGGALFLTKNRMTLFNHHLLFHPRMRYILQLPTFLSHLQGGAPRQIHPILPHFNKNCLEIPSPWGGRTCTPLATPIVPQSALCLLFSYSVRNQGEGWSDPLKCTCTTANLKQLDVGCMGCVRPNSLL